MSHSISKSQFKAHALEFFRQVESSREPIIITDHGRPTLELRPYRSTQRHPMDLLEGSLLKYDNPMDPVGEDDWSVLK